MLSATLSYPPPQKKKKNAKRQSIFLLFQNDNLDICNPEAQKNKATELRTTGVFHVVHIAFLNYTLHVCVRELERTVKGQEEKQQEEEMKRLREEELKKKSKKPGKKDIKEGTKRKSLPEGRQVCIHSNTFL